VSLVLTIQPCGQNLDAIPALTAFGREAADA